MKSSKDYKEWLEQQKFLCAAVEARGIPCEDSPFLSKCHFLQLYMSAHVTHDGIEETGDDRSEPKGKNAF